MNPTHILWRIHNLDAGQIIDPALYKGTDMDAIASTYFGDQTDGRIIIAPYRHSSPAVLATRRNGIDHIQVLH